MGKGKSRFGLPEGLAKQPHRRPVKVAGLIQKVLSEQLLREIRDPALQSMTISGVDMTGDLKVARIMYFCGAKEVDEVQKGLARAKGFLRQKLARELSLKYVPDLKFFYDTGQDHQARMEQLFAEIADERGKGDGSEDDS